MSYPALAATNTLYAPSHDFLGINAASNSLRELARTHRPSPVCDRFVSLPNGMGAAWLEDQPGRESLARVHTKPPPECRANKIATLFLRESTAQMDLVGLVPFPRGQIFFQGRSPHGPRLVNRYSSRGSSWLESLRIIALFFLDTTSC